MKHLIFTNLIGIAGFVFACGSVANLDDQVAALNGGQESQQSEKDTAHKRDADAKNAAKLNLADNLKKSKNEPGQDPTLVVILKSNPEISALIDAYLEAFEEEFLDLIMERLEERIWDMLLDDEDHCEEEAEDCEPEECFETDAGEWECFYDDEDEYEEGDCFENEAGEEECYFYNDHDHDEDEDDWHNNGDSNAGKATPDNNTNNE